MDSKLSRGQVEARNADKTYDENHQDRRTKQEKAFKFVIFLVKQQKYKRDDNQKQAFHTRPGGQ